MIINEAGVGGAVAVVHLDGVVEAPSVMSYRMQDNLRGAGIVLELGETRREVERHGDPLSRLILVGACGQLSMCERNFAVGDIMTYPLQPATFQF